MLAVVREDNKGSLNEEEEEENGKAVGEKEIVEWI